MVNTIEDIIRRDKDAEGLLCDLLQVIGKPATSNEVFIQTRIIDHMQKHGLAKPGRPQEQRETD